MSGDLLLATLAYWVSYLTIQHSSPHLPMYFLTQMERPGVIFGLTRPPCRSRSGSVICHLMSSAWQICAQCAVYRNLQLSLNTSLARLWMPSPTVTRPRQRLPYRLKICKRWHTCAICFPTTPLCACLVEGINSSHLRDQQGVRLWKVVGKVVETVVGWVFSPDLGMVWERYLKWNPLLYMLLMAVMWHPLG